MAYFAIGTTLAGMVNMETYTGADNEFAVRLDAPIPLTGGVRRRTLAGLGRHDGWINGELLLPVCDSDGFDAFMYGVFGGWTTPSVARYMTLIDESGHYNSFYGYIDKPTFRRVNSGEAVADVLFPLTNLVFQSVTKTGNYTVTTADHLVYANTASGNITLTLPAVAGVAQNVVYSAVKTSGSNTLTLDGNSSETIDGAATLAVTANNARVDLVYNGSQWVTI
jgi:hypothetical protein